MFRKQSPLPSGNKIHPPKSDAIAEFSDSIPDCGNDLATVFIIHKRELSDSTIESGSSLFYLLHCSAHDRLNTMTFRSFRNIPHGLHHGDQPRERVEARLCLSTSRTDCIIIHIHSSTERKLCLSTSRMDCISKIAQMQCHKSTQYAVSW